MNIIKKIRIGNIELRPIKENKNYVAEIIRWQPNPRYKHEDDYNWDEEKEWATAKDHKNHRIHKNCFANPESCYVLSFIDDFKEGEEPDIIECGSRVITLNNEDLQDYIKVCELMFSYIRGN